MQRKAKKSKKASEGEHNASESQQTEVATVANVNKEVGSGKNSRKRSVSNSRATRLASNDVSEVAAPKKNKNETCERVSSEDEDEKANRSRVTMQFQENNRMMEMEVDQGQGAKTPLLINAEESEDGEVSFRERAEEEPDEELGETSQNSMTLEGDEAAAVPSIPRVFTGEVRKVT